MTTPEADDHATQNLLEEVVATDRKFARTAVNNGVRTAQQRWIEAPLIAEALTLELVDLAQISQSAGQIAEQLRAIASAIETQNPLH